MSSDVDPYVETLVEHYRPLISADKESFRAVDWGSRESQFERFSVLAQIGTIRDSSIVDVGCGVGHFVDYLEGIGHRGSYIGIDAVPEMVEAARARHPDRRFEIGVPSRERPELRADYVLASGILVFSDWDLSRRMLAEMYELAGVACGFNSLSTWTPDADRSAGEYRWDPAALLEYCRSLTPWIALRHDYLIHDVTLYLYRQRQPQPNTST